jgi:hypothetical protein
VVIKMVDPRRGMPELFLYLDLDKRFRRRRFVDEQLIQRICAMTFLRDVRNHSLQRVDVADVELAARLLHQPTVVALFQQPRPLVVGGCD